MSIIQACGRSHYIISDKCLEENKSKEKRKNKEKKIKKERKMRRK
jgi:hypothetical protein